MQYPLLVAALVGVLCVGPARAGWFDDEDTRAGDPISKYEDLYRNRSPALESRRDEITYRLGVLLLERARRAGRSESAAEGDYRRAIRLFTEVDEMGAGPYREDAIYGRAIAWDETGRDRSALEAFRSILERHPDSPRRAELEFRLAGDALRRGETREAISRYRRSIQAGPSPTDDSARYMLAWSLHAAGDVTASRDEAVALLRRLRSEGAGDANLREKAVELLADAVVAARDPELDLGPAGSPWIPDALARAATRLGETGAHAEAARARMRRLGIVPDEPGDELIAIAQAWGESGDEARAFEWREKALRWWAPDGRFPSSRHDVLLPLARRQALELHERARASNRAEHFREAARAYHRVLANVSGDEASEARFLLAEALREGGLPDEAAREYEAVSAAGGAKLGAEAARRRLALVEDDPRASDAERIDAYAEALAAHPDAPGADDLRKRLVAMLHEEGRHDEAVERGLPVWERTRDAELALLVARSSLASRRFGLAARVAREAESSAELASAAREIRLAASFAAASDPATRPTEAIETYRAILELDPEGELADASRHNLALSLEKSGRRREAAHAWREAAATSADPARAREAAAAATRLATGELGPTEAARWLVTLSEARSGFPPAEDWLADAAALLPHVSPVRERVDLRSRILERTRGGARGVLLAEQARDALRLDDADRAASLAKEALRVLDGDGDTRSEAAEARFVLGELATRRFEAIALTEPLAKSLKAKTAAFEDAVRHYRQARDEGWEDASLASSFRIGYLHASLARAIEAAPRPTFQDANEGRRYEALLREKTKPYRESAESAFRSTLEAAAEAGTTSEWVARAERALEGLKRTEREGHGNDVE